MLTPKPAHKFKKQVQKATLQGRPVAKLREVIKLLAAGQPLPAQYLDHPLKGDWKGFRELHITADWLLVYRVLDGKLLLARVGTHAEIFEE